MPDFVTQLLELYLRLGGGIVLGWVLGRLLPKVVPIYLGKFLFWVGIPLSIFAFLRRADLTGQIWIAPAIAWAAMLLGVGLAWVWVQISQRKYSYPTQGSLLLASMIGNTSYLGYPVTLALAGTKYFAWALFYDLLGSTLGAYGLGVILAAHFGMEMSSRWQIISTLVKNPALWSFGIGLGVRQIVLPESVEQSLQIMAWGVVAIAIVLIGMRLSQLSSWRNLHLAAISLVIKMLLVPLVLGIGLFLLGIKGLPLLVMVLQMGMCPAFATLILAETYNLDRELAVTALAMGSIGLLFTLPIWLLIFGT